MTTDFLKPWIRNMRKHRVFSVITISGLSLGIAACLIIFSVIRYELSFDKFQPHFGNIYQIVTQDDTPDGTFYTAGIPFPARDALKVDFPDIPIGAICVNYGSQVSVLDETGSRKNFIEEQGFFFADDVFFDIFKYTWLEGSPEVLKHPNVSVLTKKTATKYFGDWQQAMGKTLYLDNAVSVKVAGILEDIPQNSDFQFRIITSFETQKTHPDTYFYTDIWGATTSNFHLYMLLPDSRNPAEVNRQLLDFSKKNYAGQTTKKRINFLQPLREAHFDPRFTAFEPHITEKSSLWTMGLIGIFIILMACINFINLSTAQAAGRSKEIGIRKVLGSNKFQIFRQVMAETAALSAIAIVLGTLLATLCMPFIKHVTAIEETLSVFTPAAFLFLSLLWLFVTVLAGVYPALIVSGFKPVLALKNKISTASVGGISLRRVLVVSQFAISQILIIGTIIALAQMEFIRKADLGYNQKAILNIRANQDSISQSRFAYFKESLLKIPGVKAVSFSSDVPSSQNDAGSNFGFNRTEKPDFILYTKFGDSDYFETFGFEMAAGKPYSRSDTAREVVVNETFVRRMGLQKPEDAIGKEIFFGGVSGWKTISGVVKDFRTNTLRQAIKPLAMASSLPTYQVASVKILSENLAAVREKTEMLWNQIFPEYAYRSEFMEQEIMAFYDQETKLALLYKVFAGIALFISCLGLYGLISFMAVQKTKEIGVRKVLGATVGNIVYLFSKEFTLLILIAVFISVPVGWYLMNGWLENFAYRISISPWVFVIAVLLSVLIAWLTVGYKSFKAALTNPVNSLRSE